MHALVGKLRESWVNAERVEKELRDVRRAEKEVERTEKERAERTERERAERTNGRSKQEKLRLRALNKDILDILEMAMVSLSLI